MADKSVRYAPESKRQMVDLVRSGRPSTEGAANSGPISERGRSARLLTRKPFSNKRIRDGSTGDESVLAPASVASRLSPDRMASLTYMRSLSNWIAGATRIPSGVW